MRRQLRPDLIYVKVLRRDCEYPTAMHVGQIAFQPGFAPHSFGSDGDSDSDMPQPCDDPQEWPAFSRRCASPDGSGNGPDCTGSAGTVWESQVLVQGLHCAACALRLERALLDLPGVLTVRVSAAAARASVTWRQGVTLPSAWLAAPLALGYTLTPAADAYARNDVRQLSRLALWRWLVATFCMMQVMMYSAPSYFLQPGDMSADLESLLRWASWLLSVPVVVFASGPFFKSAWGDFKRHSIGMDLPVSIGIAIMFVVSSAGTFDPQGAFGREVYFDSLTMFVFFLLTGRWLEQSLRDRTAGALDALSHRLPQEVQRLAVDGSFQTISVRRLRVGDVIRVLPGDAFAADGTIVLGETAVDESLMTGESRPLTVRTGSSVMAGSHNLANAVQVRVERLGAETRYGQFLALTAQAATQKPRLAQLADQVARPFLACTMLAACATAVYLWPQGANHALMAAVAVLVVTCPCALSLATPCAMLTTAGALARTGVLVRNLQAIESLAAVDTVIFDKTGTLTDAELELQKVQVRPGVGQAEALHVAASLAQHSLHPASRALLAAAKATGQTEALLPTANVQSVLGQGVEGDVTQAPSGGQVHGLGRVRLGNAAFCKIPAHGLAQSANAMQVYLCDAHGWLARFELDEQLRADAAQTVTQMRSLGLATQVLSGDREVRVLRVAEALGVRHAQGDCMPQTKLAELQRLQRAGHKVMVVGDGMNDGAVLAGANVSVAMGDAVPLSQARCDFVLPGGQLSKLAPMIEQARATMRVVRQNLIWAAAYNALCVPLAVAGWMPAWLAGLGMAASSLLVIANAARLSRWPGIGHTQAVA